MILLPNLILIFVVPILLNLNRNEALYFGGTTGFMQDTLGSLIAATLYFNPSLMEYEVLVKAVVIAILLLSGILIIEQLITKNENYKSSPSFLIFVLIALCVVENCIQFAALGIKFPIGRSALFYIPLFSLLMVTVIEILFTKSKQKATIIAVTISFLFTTNLVHSFTLKSVINYEMNPDMKSVVKYLLKHNDKIPPEKSNTSIGVGFKNAKDLNGYRFNYHTIKLNQEENYPVFHPLYDYYLIDKSDLPKLQNISTKLIEEYPNSHALFLVNTTNWKKKELYHHTLDYKNNKTSTHPEYIEEEPAYNGAYSYRTDPINRGSEGFAYSVDSALSNHKNSLVIVTAIVYSYHSSADASLIISFENNGKVYRTSKTNLRDYSEQEKEWTSVYLTAFLPQEIKKGDIIKSYIWNTGTHDVYIGSLEFKIINYEQ